MKLKFLLIFLIALLAISAVHAEDNQTDEQIAHDTNITVESKMWAENLTDIEVQLPETAQGNLSVKINNETIYDNYTQDKSFKIPITLPAQKSPIFIIGWPPESKVYHISAFYNDVQINMTSKFEVYNHNRTYDYSFAPHEILQYGQYDVMTIRFPSTSEGYIDVYIDDKFAYSLNASRWTFLEGFGNLALGNHTLRIEYSGDDYFLASNKTYVFNVTNVLINIPDEIVINHDDCISVDVLPQAKCTVSVYVDGMLFKKGTTEDGEYLQSLFDLSCRTHEIEVKVTGKYSRTIKKTVNVTYYIDADSQTYIYGPDNSYFLYLPEDLNPELLNVTIGGVRYTDFDLELGGADIDISHLKKGNYSVYVAYDGDEKYYPYNTSGYIIVDYEIICPYYIVDEDAIIYLYLPSEAEGNLTLYVNGTLHKSVKLNKGYASISLASLAPNEYNFEISYDGNDFEVESVNASVTVEPELMYEMDIEAGDKDTITLIASKNAEGYVLFNISGKIHKVTVKNGRASYTVSGLAVGEYDFEVKYVGSDGYNATLYAFIYVDYTTPKIKASNKIAYATQNTKYTFKVYGRNAKAVKNKYVKVKIAKKTYKVKTNSKGVASFTIPKLSVGRYNVQITYSSAKVTKKITVKHIVSLDAVNVKKSSKKLTLTAKLAKNLKGKTITFKFNGKTYKAKTNAKGIAKVTVKKSVLNTLKVGKKVTYTASYLKDTAKKSVKVGK